MRIFTLHLVLLFLIFLKTNVAFDHRTKRFLPFVRRHSAIVQVKIIVQKRAKNQKQKVLKIAYISFFFFH